MFETGIEQSFKRKHIKNAAPVRKVLSKLQAKSSSHEGEIKIKSDNLMEDLQENIINYSFGLEHAPLP